MNGLAKERLRRWAFEFSAHDAARKDFTRVPSRPVADEPKKGTK